MHVHGLGLLHDAQAVGPDTGTADPSGDPLSQGDGTTIGAVIDPIFGTGLHDAQPPGIGIGAGIPSGGSPAQMLIQTAARAR